MPLSCQFLSNLELVAALIPRHYGQGKPIILDACSSWRIPALERAALEKEYCLRVCDINPGVGVERCDIRGKLPYADGVFVGVISCDTIEHVHDVGHVLGEFNRITMPGGFLLLHLPIDTIVGGDLRAETIREPLLRWGHVWAVGTDMLERVEAAGYAVVGTVRGYDHADFHDVYLIVIARKAS